MKPRTARNKEAAIINYRFPFASATIDALTARVADLTGGISSTAKNRFLPPVFPRSIDRPVAPWDALTA
jgi:hypothetical protein